MKTIRFLSVLLLAVAVCAPPAHASPADSTISAVKDSSPTVAVAQVSAVEATYAVVSTPDAATSAPSKTPLIPIELMGFSLMGAVAATKGPRKITLTRSYILDGVTYGPGRNIEVPEHFPELTDDGDVIFEKGSKAERNAARGRQAPAPAGTPIQEPTTVSGKTLEELGRLSSTEIVELAESLGLEVTREDGNEPVFQDYVTALSAPESE